MEAINFFQAIFTFKSFSAARFSRSENQLVYALIGEGREFTAIAETEMKNGKTTFALVMNEGDAKLKKELARIAVWHYHQAANRYRRAANQFEQAAKIWQRTKREEVVKIKAEETLELALEAESDVRLLKEL